MTTSAQPFKIPNSFSGEAQCIAKIKCAADERPSVKLGLAVKWAHATGADLTGANLHGANLTGANLHGAYLDGADLDGKKLSALIARATRNDGYEFFLWRFEDGSHVIVAGCRAFTVEEFRAHVASQYPGTAKATETLAILAFLATRLSDTVLGEHAHRCAEAPAGTAA